MSVKEPCRGGGGGGGVDSPLILFYISHTWKWNLFTHTLFCSDTTQTHNHANLEVSGRKGGGGGAACLTLYTVLHEVCVGCRAAAGWTVEIKIFTCFCPNHFVLLQKERFNLTRKKFRILRACKHYSHNLGIIFFNMNLELRWAADEQTETLVHSDEHRSFS